MLDLQPARGQARLGHAANTQPVRQVAQTGEQRPNRHRQTERQTDTAETVNSDVVLCQAGIIDGRILTTTDSAILWRRLSKSHIWMNFPEWLAFVEQLTEVCLSVHVHVSRA